MGLNVGFGSDDDKDRVAENRARAASVFETSADRLSTVYQVHGIDVAAAQKSVTQAVLVRQVSGFKPGQPVDAAFDPAGNPAARMCHAGLLRSQNRSGRIHFTRQHH